MARYGPDRVTVHVIERDGRLLVRWSAADTDTFSAIKYLFKASFPRHGDACWVDSARSWSMPSYRWNDLARWVNAHFDPAAADWPSDTTVRPGRQELDAAYAALYLRPSAPLWAAEAVYRAAVKLTHPDVGGAHEHAVAVNAAIETIRQHQQLRSAS